MNNNINWCDRYGSWALVTGASSGIGEEFCRQLAEKKMNIILVARRSERLSDLADEIHQQHGIDTLVIVQDLSEATAAEKIKSQVGDREVGLLVNNAGFGLAGRFLELDGSRLSEMVRLNCLAPVELTQLFFPEMLKRGKGAIIFLASTAAYQATPYFAVYGATKVFNLFLGEALWQEYHNDGIDVLVLSPGYTETEFHRVAGVKRKSRGATIAQSTEVVLTAIEDLGRVPSVIHGRRNRFLAFVQRFFSRRFVIKVTGDMLKKM